MVDQLTVQSTMESSDLLESATNTFWVKCTYTYVKYTYVPVGALPLIPIRQSGKLAMVLVRLAASE